MRINYKVDDRCSLVVEAEDMEGVFQFVAHADEILGVNVCGNCGSPNLKRVHRNPKGYDFYSHVCQDCRHELPISKVKATGKLYPKDWEPPFKGEKPAASKTSTTTSHYFDDDDAAF